MKTAVSIPNPIFEEAERAARRMRLSRSQLYSEALRAYLDLHRDELVTEALDRVYAEGESAVDPALSAMQLRSLPREDW